jgi:UDPglucose--hexose-1-phosphate uridylyltransferase
MPELRTDWLTGRRVIIAENRALRPNEFAAVSPVGEAASATAPSAAAVRNCPFCPGNESRTPPAVYQQCDASGRWQLRVVPNMYPAVSGDFLPNADDGPQVKPADSDIPFNADHCAVVPAVGAHEVIIESARHVDHMAALSPSELRCVLAAYSARLAAWRNDGRFRYGLVFKNQGPFAGASLAHVHSQLIALPDLPPAIEREYRNAEREFEQSTRCPYCQLLNKERSHGERIVIDRDGYIAFCPFASLQPLEVWLMPAEHRASFEGEWQPGEMDALAGVLQALVSKVEALLPQANYNWWLRSAPWQSSADSWTHWRLELLPRVTPLAGLELSTGVHINPLSPEQAARRLREA